MSKEILERFAGPAAVTPADMVMDYHVRLRTSLRDQRIIKFTEGFYASVVRAAYKVGRQSEVQTAISNLFYPALDHNQLLGFINLELFSARTFQVTGDMVDAVIGTFRNSAKHIGHLQEEECPYPAGFVWLDKPFLLTDTHDRTVAVRALSWSPQEMLFPVDGKPVGFPGVRMSAWFRPRDKDDYFTDDVIGVGDSANTELLLSHTQVVPFGQRFGGHPSDNFDPTPDDFAHLVHVLWMFMETEITVCRETPLTRPAWRRARDLKGSPKTVNVIQLRRMTYTGDDPGLLPEYREIDWSCQWVVQGHHRHIEKYDGPKHHAVPNGPDREHCAVCLVRITWVHAHIKGPEGLPLRSVEQLYRLER